MTDDNEQKYVTAEVAEHAEKSLKGVERKGREGIRGIGSARDVYLLSGFLTALFAAE